MPFNIRLPHKPIAKRKPPKKQESRKCIFSPLFFWLKRFVFIAAVKLQKTTIMRHSFPFPMPTACVEARSIRYRCINTEIYVAEMSAISILQGQSMA